MRQYSNLVLKLKNNVQPIRLTCLKSDSKIDQKSTYFLRS